MSAPERDYSPSTAVGRRDAATPETDPAAPPESGSAPDAKEHETEEDKTLPGDQKEMQPDSS